MLLRWISERPPGRVLDVGCSDGQFAALARQLGHQVTGVDLVKHEGVADRVDGFVEADLNKGLPRRGRRAYDCVVAGDVLEHIIAPEPLLTDIADRLAPGGEILVTVPNFAHWYPRARWRPAGSTTTSAACSTTATSGSSPAAASSGSSTSATCASSANRSARRSRTSSIAAGGRRRAGSSGSRPRRPRRHPMWPTLFGYQFLYSAAGAGLSEGRLRRAVATRGRAAGSRTLDLSGASLNLSRGA